jgi:hypothetical protein
MTRAGTGSGFDAYIPVQLGDLENGIMEVLQKLQAEPSGKVAGEAGTDGTHQREP